MLIPGGQIWFLTYITQLQSFYCRSFPSCQTCGDVHLCIFFFVYLRTVSTTLQEVSVKDVCLVSMEMLPEVHRWTVNPVSVQP